MRASSNKTCPLSAQWRDLENTAAATQLNPTHSPGASHQVTNRAQML